MVSQLPAATPASEPAIATGEAPVGGAKRLLPSRVARGAAPRRSLPRSVTRGQAVAHVDGVLYDIELFRAGNRTQHRARTGPFFCLETDLDNQRSWQEQSHSRTRATSGSWRTSTPARRRRPSASSFTPAA